MFLPILSLALTAFALGTAELLPNGLLPLIGDDLGVSVSQAGWVATSFALGAMLGGPIVAAATLRLPRKPLVLVLAAVFLAANALTALAGSLLLVGILRALAGAMLGGFLGTAITVAAALMPADRRATAIAIIFTGFTVSNVVGVPIGNLLGRATGWHAAFWVVSGLAAVGLIAMAAFLPGERGATGGGDEAGLGVLRNGPLWLSFAAIALGYGGLFVAYTYIAPFLTDVTGIAPGAITWVLLLFGAGLIGGNTLGGHLADRALTASVVGFLAVLVAGLALLGAFGGSTGAVLVLLVVIGAAGFGMVAPLQSYVLHVAGTASAVVSALAAAAFNGGVALGSSIGGIVLGVTPEYRLLPFIGAVTTALGLAVFLVTRRSRTTTPTTDRDDPAPNGRPAALAPAPSPR